MVDFGHNDPQLPLSMRMATAWKPRPRVAETSGGGNKVALY